MCRSRTEHKTKDLALINKQAKSDTFAELELKLHQALVDAERQTMVHLLEHYDWDIPAFTSQEKFVARRSEL